MRRSDGMGAPEAANRLARCRSIFSSISSSESGASEPYCDNMLKLICASNTAFGSGLKESNATACFCSSSIPALPRSLTGSKISITERRIAPSFLKVREEERGGDGGRVRDGLNRALGVEARRLYHGRAQAGLGQILQRPGEIDDHGGRLRASDFLVGFVAGFLGGGQDDDLRGGEIGGLDGSHDERLFFTYRENAGSGCGIFGFERGDQLNVRGNLAGVKKFVNFFAQERVAADDGDGGRRPRAMSNAISWFDAPAEALGVEGGTCAG